MLRILRPGRRRSLVVALAALAVIASACGGAGSETATADPTEPTEAPPTTARAVETTATDATVTDAAAEDEATAPGSESDPGENLFPDIEVVDVADGATINLSSELGGGDLPVLLWFWAPH